MGVLHQPARDAFAVLVTYRGARERRRRHRTAIDYAGIAVLSIGIISILLALDEGPEDGFGDPAIIALFVFGAVMLARSSSSSDGRAECARTATCCATAQLHRGVRRVLLMSAIFFGAPLPAAVLREGPRLRLRSGAACCR
jgi:hypothetical protein